MHNEGGRPFLFPGRVPGNEDLFPDVDCINPAYFQCMDRKIDYLSAQGFIPFIEVARRDVSQAWKRFYDWPESYVRYVQYVFSRYQGNNCILSPIHLDSGHLSILSRDYNEPANMVVEKGVPAFGTLLSCNASGSSLSNFGNSDEARWLTLHQIGNRRHHNSHWLLTQIYLESVPPKPALNGEPYYAGFPPGRSVPPDTDEAALYCRSGMYGSFLSGGFAGHIYGAAGLWSGDIEPEADYKMWDALQWDSGAQMQHLRTFALSEGLRYRDLVPDADLVYPSKSYDVRGNRGWAYCARTPEKDLLMLYFEAGCPQATVRAAQYLREYEGTWFNPRTGEWTPAGTLASYTRDEEARDFDPERDEWWKALGSRASAPSCEIHLPPPPSDDDWALKLVLKE